MIDRAINAPTLQFEHSTSGHASDAAYISRIGYGPGDIAIATEPDPVVEPVAPTVAPVAILRRNLLTLAQRVGLEPVKASKVRCRLCGHKLDAKLVGRFTTCNPCDLAEEQADLTDEANFATGLSELMGVL